MRHLPSKSVLSKKKADYHKRYFGVGEHLVWQDLVAEKRKSGTITAIKQNKYGRVSYCVGEKLVILEEILAAMP